MPEQYSKLAIARIQLDRALDLFLTGQDHISAITLAGAAEDILGKLIKLSDPDALHALDEIVKDTNRVERWMGYEESERKGVIGLANYYRDHLKHIRDGNDLFFDADFEAASMIDRAINNYWRLTGQETTNMQKFKELRYFG